MFILKKDCKTIETVNQMYEYMLEKGLKFKYYGEGDSSPYAKLKGDTSIGYRIRSKWNKKGIVFFCAADEIDKDRISKELNLDVHDNSKDRYRPYAIFIPEEKFEKAVDILRQNPKNI
jgi:hypothetical protein